MLERERDHVDRRGRRVRIVGTIRWSDFDLFGALAAPGDAAGVYFMDLMQATCAGQPFDVDAMRDEALARRAWLRPSCSSADLGWDETVVVTHFAPSVRSAAPALWRAQRYRELLRCDDDLLPLADLWLAGHLHCVHDYRVAMHGGGIDAGRSAMRAARAARRSGAHRRVWCRGLAIPRVARVQNVERRCRRSAMPARRRRRSRAAYLGRRLGWIVVIASRPNAVPMSAGSSEGRRAARREVDR